MPRDEIETPSDGAAELGHWVNRAERGESFVYGYLGPACRPWDEAMQAARRLKDLGMVALTTRREPDGRLAYIAQRTWKPVGDVPERARPRACIQSGCRGLAVEAGLCPSCADRRRRRRFFREAAE